MAAQASRWMKGTGVFHLGDPFQPHGASPQECMQMILNELFNRAPGIRHQAITFCPLEEHLHSMIALLLPMDATPDKLDGFSMLERLLQMLLTGMAPSPASDVAKQLGLEPGQTHLMIHSTVRLHPIMYLAMMMSGCPSGLLLREGILHIGMLHPHQEVETANGRRSLFLPALDCSIHGLMWLDTTSLFNTADEARRLSTWLPLLKDILAYFCHSLASQLKRDSRIGLVVTYSQLAEGLQRHFIPTGHRDVVYNEETAGLTLAEHVSSTFARIKRDRDFEVRKATVQDWAQLIQTAPSILAPYLQVGTAISGAGTTFAVTIYLHARHSTFTLMPAASIVGTTRDRKSVV